MIRSNNAASPEFQLSHWGKVDAIQGLAFIVEGGSTQPLLAGGLIELGSTLKIFQSSTVMVTFELGQKRIFHGVLSITFDENTMRIIDQETQTPSRKNRHDFEKMEQLMTKKNENYEPD